MLPPDLQSALSHAGGVVSLRTHPELVHPIKYRQRTGELTALLPGVFAASGQPLTPWLRARAVHVWRPDAVVVGAAAAALTYWPQQRVRSVDVAMPTPPRCSRPGFHFTERRVPPELTLLHNGVRLSTPALTALDLSATDDGEAIDRALLRRVVTLAVLRHALELTGGRRGNDARRAVLLDSRDKPWSQAERRAHRLFRAADLRGWRSNLPVRIDGQTFYIDIAFARLRLAIEIDGREFHGMDRFEYDRWRQNLLVREGWTVLRFTWLMLVEEPDTVVELVRAVLRNVGSIR